MRRRILLVAAVLAVALTTTNAYAARHTYPGDYESPQAAIDAAGPGDTVVIAGDWAGRIEVEKKNDLRILGKKKATLSGGDSGEILSIVDSQNIEVRDLRLKNAAENGLTVRNCVNVILKRLVVDGTIEHGIAVGSSSVVGIQQCEVLHAAMDGIHLGRDLTGTAPTTCLVNRNEILEVGGDGIEVTGGDCVVSKNRVTGVGSCGINLDEDALGLVGVTKNRISVCGKYGIQMRSAAHVVTKNRVEKTGDDGIMVEGDDGIVLKNRVDDSGEDGIDVEGERNLILKNRIQGTAYDSIDADGNDNTFVKNKVTDGNKGVDVSGHGNVFEKNKFLGNAEYGIVVSAGTGNRFTKNTAKRNGDQDIWTDVPAGDNTWEKNRFRTGNAPD